jgi:hypothetical protein
MANHSPVFSFFQRDFFDYGGPAFHASVIQTAAASLNEVLSYDGTQSPRPLATWTSPHW